MTAPQFTPDGIQVQTFQEIYDELAAGYRVIYGDDINLDLNSPDGQRVAIEAQLVLDSQSFGALEYNQRDPDFALGQSLNSIIKLSGITRRPATRSQVDVTVVTDRPLTLPIDYTVEDDLGQSWSTLAVRSLAAGTTTVTLFALAFGAIAADSATIVNPVTVVIGVISVTNPSSATVGIDEETDQELRVRRNRSLETPQSSSIGRMFNALASVANVTDVAVYENDTDTTDSDSIPAHSLFVVVEGGAVANIVETMTKNKTGGKGMIGAVTGDFTEEFTRPNGTIFTIVSTMTFDRPVFVSVLVRLNATFINPNLPIDDEAIRQEIATKQFSIGDDLLAGDLYQLAFRGGSNFIPTNLEISSDNGATYTDGRISTALNGKLRILADNVTVTEVIP